MVEVQDFLVCPVSKQPMEKVDDDYIAPCGFAYRNGDFRINLDFSPEWAKAQQAYESWLVQWRTENDSVPSRMKAVDAGFDDVYSEIKLDGKVLDVAGDIGTVVTQADLDPEQYVSLDVMRIDFPAIERDHPNYARHYIRSRHCPMIQGSAEFLPVKDLYFDTVQMRGCIDHFTAPHVALMEAFRVLKPGGSVVVGVTLEGAYQMEDWSSVDPGQPSLARSVYKAGVDHLKRYPRVFGVATRAKGRLMGQHDHHMFHPTYDAVTELIKSSGFQIEKQVWQKAYHNVLYVSARKPSSKAARGHGPHPGGTPSP